MAKPGQVVIEKNKRLSESMLWSAQREYYHEQGVSAWSGSVPFYITSNPFIANAYANIVLRFIQDYLKRKPKAISQTFYIVEIGAGSGQFSYYVQRRLKILLESLGLQELRYCYVMTDFTENNIHYWETHSALAPFLAENTLDFSVYDAEKAQSLNLIRSKKKLSPGKIQTPLIVFANYLFDSLINDAFFAENDTIFESKMSMQTDSKNLKNKKPVRWKQVKFSFSKEKCPDSYYRRSILDSVLNSYRQDLKKSSFLFPIGALRCIENLEKIGQGEMLLISTDKGYSFPSEIEGGKSPEFDFHGSFSLMVNYDAIAKYFKAVGGDAFLQKERDDIVTNVFVSGTHFKNNREMQLSLKQFMEGFSPGDYFNLYDNITKEVSKNKTEALISFLNLSDWDPFVYEDFADHLNEQTEKMDQGHLEFLSDNLRNVADKFYYLPKAYDIFFDIAIFYQNIDRYDDALYYYQRSQDYFGESHALFYNRGLCYYYDDLFESALMNFEAGLKLKPKDSDIQAWVKKLRKKLGK